MVRSQLLLYIYLTKHKPIMEATLTLEKMTVTAFRQMEFADNDPYIYELIDGELVKKSAASPRHQAISFELSLALGSFIKQNQLGKLYYAPIDVFLDGENSIQPDLLFIPTADAQIVTNDGIMGAPPLVVEIISPSSGYRDRVEKAALYRRFGVQEYWLVDPQEELIEILALTNGRYDTLSAASPDEGQLVSGVLPGLMLTVADLFL